MIGTAVSAGLLPFMGLLPSASFLGGSLLIDLDHYLDFLVHNRFRSFSIRKMFLYHRHLFLRIKRAEFLSLEIFHTVEFLAFMEGWALWSGSLLLQTFTAGMITHSLCDMLYLKWLGAFRARTHSILEFFVRRRRLIRKGLAIERPYEEVLALLE